VLNGAVAKTPTIKMSQQIRALSDETRNIVIGGRREPVHIVPKLLKLGAVTMLFNKDDDQAAYAIVINGVDITSSQRNERRNMVGH
jgi:hypothetical protein